MSKKNNLLSIGEVSKLTGAGIKALRYYEQINILNPAYVSPNSGYRYYTFDQMFLVSLIMFCVEMDIPLAKMTKFIEPDGTLDCRSFINEGRKVAEKKLAAIKKGLRIIDQTENYMNLFESYQIGEIYTREIPEMVYYVKPCEKPLCNTGQIEFLKFFSGLPFLEDICWEDEDIAEHGILCEHSGTEATYYYFVKIPKNLNIESTKIIPGGSYLCVQTKRDDGKIENAAKIFGERIGNSFIAIETEIITERYKANEPVWELRAICIPS